jgi:hypothetical protein
MIPNPSIEVQTSPVDRPSVPAWFAEVVILRLPRFRRVSHGLRNEIVAELSAEVERGKLPGARESPQPSREGQKQMRKTSCRREQPQQESMRLCAERRSCPRREGPSLKPCDRLRCSQAEKSREMLWHAEELDGDWFLPWCTRIAQQALCP